MITFKDKPILEPYTIYIQNFDFQRYLEYANEDLDCELLEGVLIIHSPASLVHESIFKFLLTLLELYTQQNDLGIVVGSRFSMKLSEKWAPEPDIIYIQKDMKDQLKETYLDGPAAVIFEILSSSTREDDLYKKIPRYLAAGINEIWIIDPDLQQISIYSEDDITSFSGTDWIQSNVITGFKIQTDWLWNPSEKAVIDAFNEINQKTE
jgi:Uma2 family endonuclease